MQEKLSTRGNLVRRGVSVPSNLCLLCRKVEETAQHVLINCEVEQKVWDSCDRWIGISSVRHHKVVNHFQNFQLFSVNKNINTMWNGMWVVIVWRFGIIGIELCSIMR